MPVDQEQPFSLMILLSLPAHVPCADSFRLGIHMRATGLAPEAALAPRLPLQRELAPVEPEPEAALRECPREGP